VAELIHHFLDLFFRSTEYDRKDEITARSDPQLSLLPVPSSHMQKSSLFSRSPSLSPSLSPSPSPSPSISRAHSLSYEGGLSRVL
jgi:hypothetical protein